VLSLNNAGFIITLGLESGMSPPNITNVELLINCNVILWYDGKANCNVLTTNLKEIPQYACVMLPFERFPTPLALPASHTINSVGFDVTSIPYVLQIGWRNKFGSSNITGEINCLLLIRVY